MVSLRQLFLNHVGQTSNAPLQLEIEKAKGIYLYDATGKSYIDLIAGVSVSNVGHSHPDVIQAVKAQVEKHMHLMVYGEYIQSPQVELAHLLSKQLPEQLNCSYFVNSGSEANEAALKLAKRYTGRSEIIAFKKAYHGSSHGALSITGEESFKRSFRPLLPDIRFLNFNSEEELRLISPKTACVIIEPVQAEAGIRMPENNFLKKLRKRCDETETLLIFDEMQTGFGRLGTLFGFQKYSVTPDIITVAKALGGGMPLGAMITSKNIMDAFKTNPVLGHITTFGGHPVACAAALASLKIIIKEKLVETANNKGQLFLKLLHHPLIRSIHGTGLFFAVELASYQQIREFIAKAIENGLVTDWFIFNDKHFRIAPPLSITTDQIKKACGIILKTLDEI